MVAREILEFLFSFQKYENKNLTGTNNLQISVWDDCFDLMRSEILKWTKVEEQG